MARKETHGKKLPLLQSLHDVEWDSYPLLLVGCGEKKLFTYYSWLIKPHYRTADGLEDLYL